MNTSAELRTTTNLVKMILEKYPHTRNSDDALIVEVYRYIYPPVITLPFGVVMKNLKEWKMPSIKSIERCRRRLQREYPELSADANVEAGRELNEETYMDFFARRRGVE